MKTQIEEFKMKKFENKEILIVEDIIDSGLTLNNFIKELRVIIFFY